MNIFEHNNVDLSNQLRCKKKFISNYNLIGQLVTLQENNSNMSTVFQMIPVDLKGKSLIFKIFSNQSSKFSSIFNSK